MQGMHSEPGRVANLGKVADPTPDSMAFANGGGSRLGGLMQPAARGDIILHIPLADSAAVLPAAAAVVTSPAPAVVPAAAGAMGVPGEESSGLGYGGAAQVGDRSLGTMASAVAESPSALAAPVVGAAVIELGAPGKRWAFGAGNYEQGYGTVASDVQRAETAAATAPTLAVGGGGFRSPAAAQAVVQTAAAAAPTVAVFGSCFKAASVAHVTAQHAAERLVSKIVFSFFLIHHLRSSHCLACLDTKICARPLMSQVTGDLGTTSKRAVLFLCLAQSIA